MISPGALYLDFADRGDPVDHRALLMREPTLAEIERINRIDAVARAQAFPRAVLRDVPIAIQGGVPVIGGRSFPAAMIDLFDPYPGTAFPFILTAGSAVDAWLETLDDMQERYLADRLATERLDATIVMLRERIHAKYRTGHLALYMPGNRPDLPLAGLTDIFSLVGDAAAHRGVRLNEAGAILPLKSMAGIFLPAAREMEACEACALNATCERRR